MNGLAGQIRDQGPSVHQSLPKTDFFSSQDNQKPLDLFNRGGFRDSPIHSIAQANGFMGFKVSCCLPVVFKIHHLKNSYE